MTEREKDLDKKEQEFSQGWFDYLNIEIGYLSVLLALGASSTNHPATIAKLSLVFMILFHIVKGRSFFYGVEQLHNNDSRHFTLLNTFKKIFVLLFGYAALILVAFSDKFGYENWFLYY